MERGENTYKCTTIGIRSVLEVKDLVVTADISIIYFYSERKLKFVISSFWNNVTELFWFQRLHDVEITEMEHIMSCEMILLE